MPQNGFKNNLSGGPVRNKSISRPLRLHFFKLYLFGAYQPSIMGYKDDFGKRLMRATLKLMERALTCLEPVFCVEHVSGLCLHSKRALKGALAQRTLPGEGRKLQVKTIGFRDQWLLATGLGGCSVPESAVFSNRITS